MIIGNSKAVLVMITHLLINKITLDQQLKLV